MPSSPTPRAMAVLVILAACGHSDPATVDPDRWTGPWQQGTTIQLFPNPIAMIGFSADGKGLLVRRHEAPRVRPPYGPTRRDSGESFVAYLPANGGSGVWDWSDDRPSQFDSLNNVVAAALSAGGRLLVQEETGPIPFDPNHYPVFWHAELYVIPPADPGRNRKLLDLYDDIEGHATVAAGTLNWFTRLEWIGEDRFIGDGAHRLVQPKTPLQPLGLFGGAIGADTTSITLIDPLDGIQGWSVTADGQVLLRSGLDLLLRPAAPGPRTPLATIPSDGIRTMLAARCDLDACWAVTGTDASPFPDWEIWRVDRRAHSVQMVRKLSPNPRGLPVLPPVGTWAVVVFNGIPYRIDDVLSNPQ